jgi:hypothetical protein
VHHFANNKKMGEGRCFGGFPKSSIQASLALIDTMTKLVNWQLLAGLTAVVQSASKLEKQYHKPNEE